jgi:hypothetical protein
MLRRLLLSGIVSLMLVASIESSSYAYCLTGGAPWDKSVSPTIPVYISTYQHHSIQNVMPGATITEIETLIKWALEIWYEDNPAGIRFVYGGRWSTQENYDASVPKVLVRATDPNTDPSDNCGLAPACVTPANCTASGCKNYHLKLTSQSYMSLAGRFWGTVPPQPWNSGFHDLVGIVVHELGHVLGMRHPVVCNENLVPGVMACESNTATQPDCDKELDGRVLKKHDKNGTLATYLWRTTYSRHQSSNNGGTTWQTGSPTMHNYYPDMPFASISTNPVAEAFKVLAFPYNRRVRFATFTPTGGWTWPSQEVDATSTGDTMYTVAAALDHGTPPYAAVVWLAGETDTSGEQTIRWAISTNIAVQSTPTWTYGNLDVDVYGIRLPHLTRKKDVKIAYDRSAGRWIVSWTTNANDMCFQTIAASGVQGPSSCYPGISIVNAPSVACSDNSQLGSYNCLVMFVENTSTVPVLKFSYGRVLPDNSFSLDGTYRSTTYIAYRSPGLAVNDESSYPFVVSMRSGSINYVYKKPLSVSAPLTPVGQMTVNTMMTSTALGRFGSTTTNYTWAAYLHTYD